MGQQEEKRKDRKSNVLGKRTTTEEIVKWNQMTALRFQTRGRHQTAPVSLGAFIGVSFFMFLLF